MMNPDTLILAGHGPSAQTTRWPEGYRIGAISGGCTATPRHPDFLFALDHPRFFPRCVCADDRVQKHVPTIRASWKEHPNVVLWPRHESLTPTFAGFEIASGGIFNSMLWAVQVASCMGYKRLWFIGCDLKDEKYRPMVERLADWKAVAEEEGIVWVCGSRESRLASFCEVVEP